MMLSLWYYYDILIQQTMQNGAMKNWPIHQFAVFVVSYGISNTIVLEIPLFTNKPVNQSVLIWCGHLQLGEIYSFVVLCFVVVMQSFIMNSHEVFINIHQGCFAGTGAIVRLPQCQWSKPDGYGKISQCITTTKHSKAKTVCIFLGIYCTVWYLIK